MYVRKKNKNKTLFLNVSSSHKLGNKTNFVSIKEAFSFFIRTGTQFDGNEKIPEREAFGKVWWVVERLRCLKNLSSWVPFFFQSGKHIIEIVK